MTADDSAPGARAERSEEESAQEQDRRRTSIWWIAVLLLLLLLSCGLLAQILFPAPRSSTGKKELYGVRALFSIYGLHQPLGVSSGPDGEVLVSDTGAQRVLLFDRNGRFMHRMGGESPADKVFSVYGSVFADGYWYVCDWALKRVWIFKPDGKVAGFFPEDPMSREYGEFGFTPYDIARFKDGFLVSTRTGIYGFDSSGKSTGRFDKTAGLGYGPSFVDAIAVDPESGRVFACDTLNRRVIAYDGSGRPLWFLGRKDEAGEIKSFFGLPRGIAVTKKGILVSDTFHQRLVLLSQDGKLLGTYCKRGAVDGAVNFPEHLAVAPDGLEYLADRENNRVQVLELREPQAPDSELSAKWKANHRSLALAQ
jgi:DNA-binding beta-propeller fold protein YncE